MSLGRPSITQHLSDSRSERLTLAAAANTFVVDGRYDRAAIMRKAVKIARDLRAGGKPWSFRMSMALRAAWSLAKDQMAATAPAPLPAPASPSWVPAYTPRAQRARAPVFLRGSRIHSHGW